jgi:hypothetical protein
MASVPFESLQGQPQRIFPVHDLDNGISYDQALRVTNAMQDQLHILERTSGNFPFPNRVPKYINEKFRRYSAEFQEDEIANAELEARLHASLHNEAEEEQRREQAMMQARDKVKMFDDISKLGLDTHGEDLNEVNPFSPEGMAHLDYLARRKHGAGFDAMRKLLKDGQEELPSQYPADRMMDEAQARAKADAATRVRRAQGQSLETVEGSAGAGTPRKQIKTYLAAARTPAPERAGKAARERHRKQQVAETMVEQAKRTPVRFNKRVQQVQEQEPTGGVSPRKPGYVPRTIETFEARQQTHTTRAPEKKEATIDVGSGGGQSKSAQKKARAKAKRKGQGERSSSGYGGRG